MRESYCWQVVEGRVVPADPADITAWAAAKAPDDGIGFDTETTGLDYWNCRVRLCQFGDDERAYAIRTDTFTGQALIRQVLEQSSCWLIAHNLGFDLHQLVKLVGIDLVQRLWPRCMDTYVQSHVSEPAGIHKLKVLSVRFLADDAADEQTALKALMAKRGWTWATIPLLALIAYAVKDAQLAYRLWRHYQATLTSRERDILVPWEMEVYRDVTWPLERRGMMLDETYARELDAKWGEDIDRRTEVLSHYVCGPGVYKAPPKRTLAVISAEAQLLYPAAFSTKKALTDYARAVRNYEAWHGPPEPRYLDNPNATEQVAAALMQQGWHPREFTDKGKVKVDKDVLEALAGQFPLVDDLLEYRRLNKWRTSYVEQCLARVDADGRVHASYNSLGTHTSRMACSAPPLQQLPKGGGGEVRRLFVASDGCVIASVDYNALQFRLAGALSGEPRIIDVYSAGGDWYQQVADDLSIQRQPAKVFVLAITFGARGRRIAHLLSVPVRRGQKLVDRFWDSYPQLAEWNTEQTERFERGIMPESWMGRSLQPHAAHAAGNAIIQATEAEVMKHGLLRLRDAQLDRYVVAIVHDEVVLDVPTGEAADIAAAVATALSDPDTFACPLVANPTVYGHSWGDGYTG